STITGHFAFVREDGPDEDDYPDVRLASSTVRFEATAKAVKAGGAWIGIAPAEARIFDGEIIVDEDDPGPPRVLFTDVDVGVEYWGWKAICGIDVANNKPVTFKVPKEGVHLTAGDLIPISGLPVEVIAEGALGRLDDLEAEVAGKAPLSHTHPIEEVDGLQDSLDGKVDDTDPRLSDARPPTAHTHGLGDVGGIAVDTSVGTRIYIGGHLVYADTGWRDMRELLAFPADTALFRRVNGQVSWVFRGVDSGTASNAPLISGFTGIGPSTAGNSRVQRDDLGIRIGFSGTLFIYPDSAAEI